MTARFVKAGPFWRFMLRRLRVVGIVMPWRSIYIHPAWFDHQGLRRHELIHIEQMDRDGTITFCMRYLWALATVGYKNIPYEQEAYGRERIE